MKKVLPLLLVSAFLFLPAAALADEGGMSSSRELAEAWSAGGYPDDVGGVFYDSATGKCGVLLLSPTDAREEEIRALVSEPDSLFFVSCAYSYNELLAIRQEIDGVYAANGEIVGTGVGWKSDEKGVSGFGESGYEMRVTVFALDAYYDKYAALFTEKYGEKVYVFASGAAAPVDNNASISPSPEATRLPDVTPAQTDEGPDILLYALIALFPVAAIVVGVFWAIRFKEKHIDGK